MTSRGSSPAGLPVVVVLAAEAVDVERDARFLREGLEDVRDHLTREISDFLASLCELRSSVSCSACVLWASQAHQAEFRDTVWARRDVDDCSAQGLRRWTGGRESLCISPSM